MTTTAPQGHPADVGPPPTGLDPAASAIGLRSVTVIVPTRNEAANVGPLFTRLETAMAGSTWEWEVVFVDDSDDETPAAITALGRAGKQVRMSWRPPGKRAGGLSGAVLAGFAAGRGDAFVVIDGDLQHPPELVPALVGPLERGDADVVVATRYAGTDADAAGLSSGYRRFVSSGGGYAVQTLFRRTRVVSDPLSGFFAVRRSVIEQADLRPHGFKILLEVLVRGRWTTVVEVPYRFATRSAGESKAGWREGMRFARHLLRLRMGTMRSGRAVPR